MVNNAKVQENESQKAMCNKKRSLLSKITLVVVISICVALAGLLIWSISNSYSALATSKEASGTATFNITNFQLNNSVDFNNLK